MNQFFTLIAQNFVGCGATKSGNLLSSKLDAELTHGGTASLEIDTVRKLMEQLAIPLSNPKTIAKWLVITTSHDACRTAIFP
jgi:hypothetical protein